MGIISALRAQIGRLITLRYNSTVVRASGVTEVYPAATAKNSIEKGFNFNTAVYSIVMKDARKFASIPRYVYDAASYEQKSKPCPATANKTLWDSKAYRIYESRPTSALVPTLTDLINRPNPYLSQDLFFEAVRCYYKTTGEGMIWLNRGDLEPYRLPDGSFDDAKIDKLPVLEMYVLPSDQMILIPDPYNVWGILGWYMEAGERVYMRKGDVIQWKTTNLNFNQDTREHLRGFSPFTPGNKSIEMNNSMTDAMVRGAQNDGAKFVLYNENLNRLSPEQHTDLKTVIDRKINNNSVKGAVAVLQGKWGGIDLGKSAHDMELLESKKFSWQEICFLLDVPFEFFDPHAPYAEKQLAMVGWITNALEPATKQLDGEMNRVLLKAFNLEGKAFIACDYTALPEMKKIATDTAKTMQDIWSISPDDVRDYLGYERLGGKFDEPWVPNGRTPMSDMNDSADEDEETLKKIEETYGN